MSETSASLLDQVRLNRDAAAWQRFVDIYTPLIRGWLLRHAALDPEDATDIAQEIWTVVVRKMPQFEREPRVGAFRRWLKSITVNCLRDFGRKKRHRPLATGAGNFQHILDQLEDPA